MSFLRDSTKEIQDIARRNHRRQLAEQQAATVTPEIAQRLAGMFRWHPWLPADVATGLARANLDPLSDETLDVSKQIIADTSKDPLGYAQPGDTVKADAIGPQTRSQALAWMQENRARGGGFFGGDVGGVGLGAAAGIAAGGIAETALPGSQQGLTERLGSLGASEESFLRDNPVTNSVLEPAMRHTLTGQNPVARGARGVIRVGTAALQAPQQMAQAQYRTGMDNIRRNGIGAFDPRRLAQTQLGVAEQTDIGQIIGSTLPGGGESQGVLGGTARSVGGGGVDTGGGGFFVSPQSRIGQARRRAEVAYGGTYSNGQVRTIGRDFADVFYEPGSQEFDVLSGFGDAAVAIGTDKAVTTPIQNAAAASKVFRSTEQITTATTPTGRLVENVMGLIRGSTRATYNADMVDAYVRSRPGLDTAARFAAETSISKLDALTGGKLPPELLTQLVDATDPATVRQLMLDNLGQGWRTRPVGMISGRIQQLGLTFKDALPKGFTRLGESMPTLGHIDFDDGREVLTQTERMLTNTKAPRATIDDYMAQIARATTARERRGPWVDMIGDIADRMAVEAGVDPAVARKLTTLYTDHASTTTKYWVDDLGNNVDTNPMRVLSDGKLVEGPTPHLSSEMFQRMMPQPDVRALRSEFSSPVSKWIMRNQAGDQRSMWTLAQGFQDRVWKPGALLRGAWPMRVLGEEQARIASTGLSSLTRDPAGYIAFALGDSPRLGRMLERWGISGRGGEDIFGGLLKESDDFAEAMMRGHGGFTDEKILSHFDNWARGETGYTEAWADELRTLAAAPEGQLVARLYNAAPVGSATAIGNPLLGAQEYFWNNMGTLRAEMMANNPNAWVDVGTRAGADRFIASVATRLSQKTRDIPELLETVRTGRIDGVNLFEPGTPFISKNAIRQLKKYTDLGPDVVRGPIRIRTGTTGSAWTRPVNALTEAGFEYLMTKPANYLSRSQVFRQKYADEIIAMSSRVGRDDIDALIKYAEDANLTAADVKRIRALAGTAAGDDPMPLKALDELAKGHALHDTKALLYDLADRGQFFDTFRLIFPFGEAWTEMVTSWGKILKTRPKVALTVKRVLEGGRNPVVGDLVGAPEGKGAFYRDEYGEERFTYPLSGQLMATLGFPEVPLTGRLQGLSLMTEVLPGIGPVAQWPLAALLPDKPAFDGLSQLLFPYGRPRADVSAVTNMLPSWARTVLFGATGGFGTEAGTRQYANTVMDVMRYNASTGRYKISGDPNSAAEITRLLEDSKSQATWMTVIRGMAQNVAPSSPTFEWYITAPDGQKLPMLTLVAEYRTMQEEDFETATQRFLAKYGDNAFLLMQGKSMTTSPGILPPTDVANDWLRDNPWAQQSYGATYGFFAPQGGEFSSQAYQRQLELQEREPLTPEEFVKAGNNLIGQSIYFTARDKALRDAQAAGRSTLTKEQSAYMRDLDAALRTEYEGYGDEAGLPGRANTDELIDELTRAVADPRLSDTAMARSISEYLTVRDTVREWSRANLDSENSYQSAKNAGPYRAVLEQAADLLAADNPDFAVVYERVFRREIDAGLKKDDAGEEG
jgi:hypothetical protein